jgi:hypothetical protein
MSVAATALQVQSSVMATMDYPGFISGARVAYDVNVYRGTGHANVHIRQRSSRFMDTFSQT